MWNHYDQDRSGFIESDELRVRLKTATDISKFHIRLLYCLGPVHMSRNRPKLTKVRLLIQTSSSRKTTPYSHRFEAKLEIIYAMESAHEKFGV